MRAKPPGTVLDHFCGICGGYLGTSEDWPTMRAHDSYFKQQNQIYFSGLGVYRRNGHIRTCDAIGYNAPSLPIRTQERREHELPDSVERKDLFLAYVK